MRHLSEIICNQNPIILPGTATVADACRQMGERKLGSALVSGETGELVGIFTGRDAVRRVLAIGKSGQTPLNETMTRGPITMEPEKTAIEALRLMWSDGFRHIPLVEHERIVGVITRGDFGSDERLCLHEELQLWEHMR